MKRMGRSEPKHKIDFKVGEVVSITDGPFKSFDGTVSEVDPVKGKLKVLVNMFGRETPVELDSLQVKRVQSVLEVSKKRLEVMRIVPPLDARKFDAFFAYIISGNLQKVEVYTSESHLGSIALAGNYEATALFDKQVDPRDYGRDAYNFLSLSFKRDDIIEPIVWTPDYERYANPVQTNAR